MKQPPPPETVGACSNIRPFIKEPGDIPEEAARGKGRYFNPLTTKIISSDVRERIYAVLRDPRTCYTLNQLFRTDAMRKIYAELNNPNYVNADHLAAMYAVLLGAFVASDKAVFYYESSRIFSETAEETIKRYEGNVKNSVSRLNRLNYLPRLMWQLCQRHAAHIADDLLKMDIKLSNLVNFDAEFEDQYWIERHVAMSPQSTTIPTVSRAYCAIATALREEENCRFYREHFRGQFSEFRQYAEQRAQQFYLRMWEILLNEKYVVPKYKLNDKESELFYRLLRYKKERE